MVDAARSIFLKKDVLYDANHIALSFDLERFKYRAGIVFMMRVLDRTHHLPRSLASIPKVRDKKYGYFIRGNYNGT